MEHRNRDNQSRVTRLLRLMTFACLLGAGCGLALGAAQSLEWIREPYLQLATPNSIHVVWRTVGSMTPIVRYGTKREELKSESSSSKVVTRASLGTDDAPVPERWLPFRTPSNLKLPKLHSAPIGTFQYEAKLTDLEPSTRYYYAVYDENRRLTPDDPSWSFVTPPPAGTREPFRFWVIGDGGTGRLPQKEVHDAMRDFVRRDGRALDFWLHVGDMAYGTGRDMEFQSRFFEPYRASLRGLVCWPTMGNHEGHTSKGTTGIGPYYDAYVLPQRAEAGGLASGTEAYYSFDHGNIHFICLDSHDLERKPSGAMARWLKADLEKTKADWLIAFWHHPPYTKGSHDSDKEKDLTEMRELIMPVIESGGVDLVLTGHSHIYERSMLMDGAYATPTVAEGVILDDGDGHPDGDGPYRKNPGGKPHEGTLQVVAGNAGQTLGRKGSSPVMRSIVAEFGSVIVDVDGDTLTARMINRDGNQRDLVQMVKRGPVKPVRLALPWQPLDYKPPSTAPKIPASPPVDYKTLVARHETWRYLASGHPQGRDWTFAGFDDSKWARGAAGFGYREPSVRTALAAGSDRPTSLYIRKEFQIHQADRITEIGLLMDFSDSFVAYLNGQEVARVGVGRSSGRNAQKIKPREDSGQVYIAFKDAFKHTTLGANIVAIEVHGAPESPSLLVDPILLLED